MVLPSVALYTSWFYSLAVLYVGTVLHNPMNGKAYKALRMCFVLTIICFSNCDQTHHTSTPIPVPTGVDTGGQPSDGRVSPMEFTSRAIRTKNKVYLF